MKRHNTIVVGLAFVLGCGPTAKTALDDAGPGVRVRAPRLATLVDTAPHREDAEVESDVARYGDPIRFVVDGLAAGERVEATFTSGAGSSAAVFFANADGVVDLSEHAPDSGSWRTAHVDGFLYSMRDPPGGALDLTVTATFELAGGEGGESLQAIVERRFVNQDIVTEIVDDGRTVGVLATPPGDGPFGGVLCFGGSEGGTFTGEFCAEYLASLGYAALGIGYFGAPGLPAELEEVPLELLEEALVYLTDDPRVAGDGVVAMGGSRGGELALLLGARFPVVTGVVAQVPSGVVWGAVSDPSAAAWTSGGEPLPFVPASPAAQPATETGLDGDSGLAFTPMFERDLIDADEAALAAATIAVEDTAGPVLLLGGEDDRLWPSCALAEIAWERLVTSGHADAHDDALACLPDAGHAATLIPGWSAVGTTTGQIGFTTTLLGGSVEGNGRAQRAADTRTRAFFERVLGPPSPPSIR